jgi:hypothetical protein
MCFVWKSLDTIMKNVIYQRRHRQITSCMLLTYTEWDMFCADVRYFTSEQYYVRVMCVDTHSLRCGKHVMNWSDVIAVHSNAVWLSDHHN